MRKWILLLSLFLACTPKPIRPFVHNDAQTKDLNECDYLYSQCLGAPSFLAPTDGQPNPVDWRGEPETDCNKHLARCYDDAVKPLP